MATSVCRDGRGKYLTCIPSSEALRQRLHQVTREARQLRILLRTARELERLTADAIHPSQHVGGGGHE